MLRYETRNNGEQQVNLIVVLTKEHLQNKRSVIYHYQDGIGTD